MSFEFTDQHVSDYYQLGFTIFRDVIPPSLLADLRVESDKARIIARQRGGEYVGRLQPIVQFPEIDMRPFDDFHHLPVLADGLNRLLAERFGGKVDLSATRDVLGVLIEPEKRAWCTPWHRDWRDNMPGLDLAGWDKVRYDVRIFNQVNRALYQDGATWVVPGSHLRDDTDGEILRFPARPVKGPDTSKLTNVEAEAACLAYCRSMPGAFQARLNAGDFMFYRNTLWHIGNCVPYCTRATLHTRVFAPEFGWFFKDPPYRKDAQGLRMTDFQNPNVNSPAYQGWAAQQPS